MATDFYMTLPSNASMKMHPDNTLTHYVTALPQRIDLTGEWECGLAEIQYPHSWYNVTENDVWLFLNRIDASDTSRRVKLSCGYYDDPLTLMYHVNKGLYSMRTDETQAQLSYSSVTQKMTLHMTPNTRFTIPYHSATASMLGFRGPVASEPAAHKSYPRLPVETLHGDSEYPFHIEADDVVNLTQGFDTLYVYTDIVESRIVGDTLAPLLRALPISGRHGDRVSARFTNVHYVPLLRSNFSSIEVDIRNDMGRRVPFEYGRVTVTLHFRRRQTRTVLMNYNDYYARQAGGALPYFAGAQYQRGHGLGSLFGSLLRSAMPLIKRGAVALGKGALKTGVRIAGDVLSGQNIKTAAKRRVTDAVMSRLRAPPGKRIKRAAAKATFTAVKRRRKKRTSTKRAADIFDDDKRWRSCIDSRARESRPSWISLPYPPLRTVSPTVTWWNINPWPLWTLEAR